MIKDNFAVSIEYEVKEEGNGEVLDSNIGYKPLEFIMGRGEVIRGLENAIASMEIGESKDIVIPPSEAYGDYNSEYVQEVPRDQFVGIDLQEGMTLFGQGENGETVQVTVKGFNDEVAIIDYNHPLAGKTLAFSVTILDAREATEQELSCGIGGHHHGGGGGCCGGGGCGCH